MIFERRSIFDSTVTSDGLMVMGALRKQVNQTKEASQ